MKWNEWTSGYTEWPFGPLAPEDVLYEFDGPAIFTAHVGLDQLLFYKSDEHERGDYYIAAAVSGEEVSALKSGSLSVRGALSHRRCWLLDVDFDLGVRRFQETQTEKLNGVLPMSGVPLYGSLRSAADSILQAKSPLAFKFFGHELKEGRIPFSIFNGLIGSVYDVVRRSLVPPSLSLGRDSDLIDFPIHQPLLASLLIAIDHPSIDIGLLKRRDRTKNLNPEALIAETEAEGAKFVEQVERTVDVAITGKITKTFARDNFFLLENINAIIPSERGDVSKLQLSSSLAGQEVFVELDRDVGERIRFVYKAVRDKPVTITGTIVGLVRRSRTFILRNRFGRELTCYLVPYIYDDLLDRGELVIGRRLIVEGSVKKRPKRDLVRVEGYPTLL